MDTDIEVSNRLAALREKLGMDQATFAKSLGIEKNTYNAYERGKRPLTIETAKKIRRRHGISSTGSCLATSASPTRCSFWRSIRSRSQPRKFQAAKSGLQPDRSQSANLMLD
jgi:DNA-binding XRE family transcriptional regulator